MVLITLFGFVVGWLRGGKFSNLANITFKFWWLIIIAWGVQGTFPFLVDKVDFKLLFMPYLASFVIILAALLANVRARFIAVVFAGVLMNFSVIALNGGMPYSKNSLGKHDSTKKAANGLHIPENERTRLEFLDDWIALPRPYPQPSIGSPGDMVISIGLLLFIQQAMRKGPEREREEDLRLAEAAGVCNRHV